MKTKSITYFGKEYVVPTWVNFVATDSDARIIGFSRKPIYDHNYDEWNDDTGGMLVIIGKRDDPFISQTSRISI